MIINFVAFNKIYYLFFHGQNIFFLGQLFLRCGQVLAGSGQKLSVYRTGNFVRCPPKPHVPKNPKSWKITGNKILNEIKIFN